MEFITVIGYGEFFKAAEKIIKGAKKDFREYTKHVFVKNGEMLVTDGKVAILQKIAENAVTTMPDDGIYDIVKNGKLYAIVPSAAGAARPLIENLKFGKTVIDCTEHYYHDCFIHAEVLFGTFCQAVFNGENWYAFSTAIIDLARPYIENVKGYTVHELGKMGIYIENKENGYKFYAMPFAVRKDDCKNQVFPAADENDNKEAIAD